MGKNKPKIPSECKDYSPMGEKIPGTPFLPFKVPLKEEICLRYLQPEERFTTEYVMQRQPKIKMIINLTDTDDGRYYNYSDFQQKGIRVLPIKVRGGGFVPPKYLLKKFYTAVDKFLSNNTDPDALIGVHCTHGANRTQYFICKYMTDRINMSGAEAITKFETARGSKCNRPELIEDILKN